MAIEKISFPRSYIGTQAEFDAITSDDKSKKYNPGDTFYCYDTKAAYIFANGDWREV